MNAINAAYLLFATARQMWEFFPVGYAILNLFVAIALIVLAFLARLFALGVQNLVIRLEERLRFQQLLPDG